MKFESLAFYAKKYAIVSILLFIIIIAALNSERFLSVSNLSNIVLQSSSIGVMCIGATFLIINGHRDLSVGMVMGLAANLVIGLQLSIGYLGILAALAAGLAIGLVNGLFVAKGGLNSFIVTMATMLGTRSLIYLYTKEQALVGRIPEFAQYGKGSFLGVPYLIWTFLALLIVGQLLLRYSVHGRNTYAVGGNKEAAGNAGINVLRTTVANFMICSLGGVIGGVMTAARMNSAISELGLSGNEHFMVIVMVSLGGTKMSGGYGNMLYTFCGIMTMGVIQNILNLLNVHAYYATMITGIMLILVLLLDKVLKPATQRQRQL